MPVPTQLQQQILRGEYVDFSVLLDKTSFVDTTHTTQHAQTSTHILISHVDAGMEHLPDSYSHTQPCACPSAGWLPENYHLCQPIPSLKGLAQV